MAPEQSRQGRVHGSIPPIALAAAVTTALTLIGTPVAANEKCPTPLNQIAVVMKVQADIFAALENEDRTAWERLTTRDFVAFEGGQQHSRTAVFEMIKKAHATGRHFSWYVTSPRLEAACTVATLIYVNHGSITGGSSRSDVSWLETATFRYAEGQWRAVFLESMRASARD
jgi:hypothetical protein